MSRQPSTLIRDSESDLNRYPVADGAYPANIVNQITIGDLHANALKLIYALIRQNVLKLSEEDYNLIRDIYNKKVADLTADDLRNFDNALARMTANPVGMVRLIGDELADRGSNDLWVLKTLERLNQLNIPVEILISNHGLGFVHGYTSGKFLTDHYSPTSQGSMSSLKNLLDRKLVSQDELKQLVKQRHYPQLKALSYSINEDASQITLYSHAPIDFTTIKNMADKLEVTYQDGSLAELANTIDAINQRFRTYVQEDKILSLFPEIKKLSEMLVSYDQECGLDRTQLSFEFLVWNRRIEKNVAFFRADSKFERSASKNGYTCQFVHGHDSESSGLAHVINLDNSWGKNEARVSENKDYLIHYSQDYLSLCHYYQKVQEDLRNLLTNTELAIPASLKEKAMTVLNSVAKAKTQVKASELPLLIEVLTLTKQGLTNPSKLDLQQCQKLLKELPGKENWARMLSGSFTAFIAEVAFFVSLVTLSVFAISALGTASGIVIPSMLLTMSQSLTLGGTIGLCLGSKMLAVGSTLFANSGRRSEICKSFSQFWQEAHPTQAVTPKLDNTESQAPNPN